MALSKKDINDFIYTGYVKVENAFSTDIATQCRDILWKIMGCDSDDPDSWTAPVIRVGEIGDKPFKEAANTSIIHQHLTNWLEKTIG